MASVMTWVREFASALTDKVFWLIVLAGVLGFAGHDLWVIAPLAVLLTLWSTISDQHWYDEFKRVGRLDALAWFWLGCLAENAMFAGLAFGVGAGVDWWWF